MSNYELMSRKTWVSWDEVDGFAMGLASWVREHGYTGVYGVPKGGLVLAVVVAYRAGVPLMMAPAPGCVVVDEIAATGTTLKQYTGRYPIATMHWCPGSSVVPDYYDREVTDEWMVYPWE